MISLLHDYIREVIEMKRSPIVESQTIIYCDMDGVLVDFETGTVSLLNSLLDDEKILDAKKGKTFWKTLRKLHNELGETWRVQSRADLDLKPVRNFMFAVISENPGGFFDSLPPLPDGLHKLWPYLNSTGHTVKLLTAGVFGNPEMPSAEAGKKMWAIKYLKPSPGEVILSTAKQKVEFAVSDGGVPNVLIDDKISTIQSWNDATEAAGFGRGFGILHIPGGSAATILRLKGLGL